MSALYCTEARPSQAAPNRLLAGLATHIGPQGQTPCPRLIASRIASRLPLRKRNSESTAVGRMRLRSHNFALHKARGRMRISWWVDHLDPSPLPSGAQIAIRRFNRRADEKACETARMHRATRAERLEASMAQATECAAPENSQGRDEWMTVIEMQNYMRASRTKAYDLIWSGEVDSYRLGRKLLVS